MTDPPQAPDPMASVVGWHSPTDELRLHTGRIRYRTKDQTAPWRPGVIRLVLRSGSHLWWNADLEPADVVGSVWRHRSDPGPGMLDLNYRGQEIALPAYRTENGGGFIATPSRPFCPAALRYVQTDWFCLPHLSGAEPLKQVCPGGGWIEWSGRTTLEIEGWRCAIDERPDQGQVYRRAKHELLVANTHTMRLARSSGETFSPEEADDVLTGLQVGISFALGRWAAPILPVGFDEHDSLAWSCWVPSFVDSPLRGSGGWWAHSRPEDLWGFLRLWMHQWAQSDDRHSLMFLATSSLAAGDQAYAEHGLMTCLAAIEHLSWVTRVSSNQMPEAKWRSKSAHWRVGRLLDGAQVDPSLVAVHTPALAAFARRRGGLDGPHALSELRDAITHPKATEEIYGRDDPLADGARLAGRYLDLLILHHVGYGGHARDRTLTTGWDGAADPVPWHAATRVL